MSEAHWPSCWCEHWIFPLHKRHALSDPDNYRGLHLTSQLSKAAERLIRDLFVPRLERLGAFGPAQFAYRKEHGARDAILYFMLSWLLAFSHELRVIPYCSDVSGAFDRVSADILSEQLSSAGVAPRIVALLVSWLRQRKVRAVIGGLLFRPITMGDMVYQGAIFGPPLWNTFFADSCMAVRAEAFEEVLYADDTMCVSGSVTAMNRLLKLIEKESIKYGLSVVL